LVNKNTILFDLSEVLISGLLGVEKQLAEETNVPEQNVLRALDDHQFLELLCGEISEEEYLTQTITAEGWNISLERVKKLIRENFHNQVPGMEALLYCLKKGYSLVLVSDHAQEWIDYILSVHSFFRVFDYLFFSFQLHQTKRESSTYQKILKTIDRKACECLLIDDDNENLISAQKVGIEGIRFTNIERLSTELTRNGINV